MSVLVEVCLESVHSALIAEKCGAGRIELCSALDLGGISPSKALIEEVTNAVKIPVFVLIRPRQGNFCYNKSELKLMLRDIEIALESGAKGIVCGALDVNSNIDIQATKEFIKASAGAPFTFHRAFDKLANPYEALKQLIDLGVYRILTSGQRPKAIEGIDLISKLIQLADNKITIMPGSGVSPNNVIEILKSGAKEIHLSARAKVEIDNLSKTNNVSFSQSSADEDTHYETSETVLNSLFEKINNYYKK